ncbi:arginine--tRNA ligase [Candidatus Izimaplasma bacterium ZiA1]|uniref:arginine--tRNA ligase n=1 Tax=Candidatus Izimoplasma sp. ZiA1 TaxID=2024899 RepID=UPI001F0B0D88
MKLNELLEKIKNEFNNVLNELEYNEHQVEVVLETPKDKVNGDYSTNLAMRLAKPLRKNPFVIAEEVVNKFNKDSIFVTKIEVARPGFINLYLDKSFLLDTINDVLNNDSDYGNSSIGENDHVNIEFVSVNPTGALHIGHARGAAAGDSMSRIMKKAGYEVTKEYYVNDGGNQIHNLTLTVIERYKELYGMPFAIPEDGYHGPEIIGIAQKIIDEFGDKFLTNEDFEFIKEYSVNALLDILKADLHEFRVDFDVWFSEKSLYEKGEVKKTVDFLKENDFTYEEDGALWLKTSNYNDEKDRVIVKSDGLYTYLTPDVAYHKNKLSRGYTKLIDILGGDHHGYIDRLKAAIEMVGGKSDLLDVEILQMVKVIQDGVEVKMSKRSGKAITLKDLIDDVGVDPIRYFFAARSLNTHMDLDLDLALKQTNENPVYYVQYANARINSLFNQAISKGYDLSNLPTSFTTIKNDKAFDLLSHIANYQSIIETSALQRTPHKLTNYIYNLATMFHSLYNDEVFIKDDETYTLERIALLKAIKIVLLNGLQLIGVSAPEKM